MHVDTYTLTIATLVKKSLENYLKSSLKIIFTNDIPNCVNTFYRYAIHSNSIIITLKNN